MDLGLSMVKIIFLAPALLFRHLCEIILVCSYLKGGVLVTGALIANITNEHTCSEREKCGLCLSCKFVSSCWFPACLVSECAAMAWPAFSLGLRSPRDRARNGTLQICWRNGVNTALVSHCWFFTVSSCTCNLVREQSYPLKITIIAHFLPYSVKNWTSNDNNISIIVCISPSHMWISLDNMYTLRYLHLSLKLVYSKFT